MKTKPYQPEKDRFYPFNRVEMPVIQCEVVNLKTQAKLEWPVSKVVHQRPKPGRFN